ncbi:MAG TPA: hypothetical protein VJJ75_00550 [Candidatus Nanoarchaeia archaeon]|nr:hypothetical protein [Candidatus Nanoarchaeia archaeon]
MQNKKIGAVLIVLSVILGGYLLTSIAGTNAEYTKMCAPNQQCAQIGTSLGWSHFAVGIIFSILSLGFYLVFFSRTDDLLLKNLEHDVLAREDEQKVKLMTKALDENERRIFSVVRDQPGITQNMVTFKTHLSKAKVSQVLSDFEKKQLVYRKPQGKTYSVYLAE